MTCDINTLGHTFINLITDNTAPTYSWQKCIICKIEVYRTTEVEGIFNDGTNWHKLTLTCNEVIIKDIIE